jgi:hypothetical protein
LKRLAIAVTVVVALVLTTVLIVKAKSRFSAIKSRDEAVKRAME